MAIVRHSGARVLSSARAKLTLSKDTSFTISVFSGQHTNVFLGSACTISKRGWSSLNCDKNNVSHINRHAQSPIFTDFWYRNVTWRWLSGYREYQTIKWRRNVHAEPKLNPKWTPGTVPHL